MRPMFINCYADTAAIFRNRGSYCKGLFGGGNRNFAELFCVTAKTLSEEYDIPMLHAFEFQGTPLDIKKMEEELLKIEHNN